MRDGRRSVFWVLYELDLNKLSFSIPLSLQETSGAKDLIILTLHLVIVPVMQRELHAHTAAMRSDCAASNNIPMIAP